MRAPLSGEPYAVNDFGAEPARIRAAADMLFEAFREHWPTAWPAREDAQAEAAAALEPGRIAVSADAAGDMLGWAGALHAYDLVWEIHPLVVRADARRCGVGRALVTALEARVAAAGGLTLMLGTNDDDGMTSLAGIDLYPDPLRHLAALADRRGHPCGFYRRLGYAVVGVIPDANGFGKPDILMAKRLKPLV